MATWAIGDLQGCLRSPAPARRDRFRSRGRPAVVLRRPGQPRRRIARNPAVVHSLRDNCVVTTGNHDLSLLAIAERDRTNSARSTRTCRQCCSPTTATNCSGWLRPQPLHRGPMAGRWCTPASRRSGRRHGRTPRSRGEVRLRGGENRRKLLRNMYGDEPMWSPRLGGGNERDRAIINVFTRMRYRIRAGASTSRKRAARHAAGRAVPVVQKCPAAPNANCASSAATGARSA